MPFNDTFGGNTIYPADPTYLALALAVNTTLQWPVEQNMAGATILAAIMDVTPAGAGLALTLPDATIGSTGYVTTFYNAGADTYTVRNSVGGTVLTVASGEAWNIYLRDNSTAAGAWRIFQMGAGTSTANAATLAGAGLEADGTTLNEEMLTVNHAVNYAILDADRANVQAWTGGSGAFTLPNPATVGAGWFVPIKNNGAGSLTITPGAGTIDGSGSLILSTVESAFVISDGTNYYTVGFGQDTSAVFDFISIDVSGTGDYTLVGAQLNRVSYEFTGILTGNRTIIVPASVQQYWVDNQTTGAFSLTVKTVSGVGVIVQQGNRAILYCDGVDVLLAQTAGSIQFSDGTAAAPGVTFASQSTMGMYRAGPGILGFSTSGTVRATVDASGNWIISEPDSGTDPALIVNTQNNATAGIEITTPFQYAAANPGLKIRSQGVGGFVTLSLCGNGATAGTNDFALFQNGTNLTANIFNRANASMNFGVNNLTRMTLDAGGNLSFPTTVTAATVGAAGGASALPATPLGYWVIALNGATVRIPYYNP